VIRKLAARLTYANVMATAAVFIALGGGAYAAIKLPANSVGTAQITKQGVKAADLGTAAVTSPKLAAKAVRTAALSDGAVAFSKLGPNAVDGSKVIDNSLGGADVNEATLDAVPAAGRADSLSRVDYETATAPIPAGAASAAATAVCPAGMSAIGGGGKVSDPNTAGLNDSYLEGRNGWTARAFNSAASPATLTTFVICATATATTP
jgi:hypothetical protein